MDGIIVFFVALIFSAVYRSKGVAASASIEVERIVTNPTLNPEMKHDEHAFMEIANELDFDFGRANGGVWVRLYHAHLLYR